MTRQSFDRMLREVLADQWVEETLATRMVVHRVPAAEIEALVVRSLRDHVKPLPSIDDRSLVSTHVARVEVKPNQLDIHLNEAQQTSRNRTENDAVLHVPWQKTTSKRRREIIVPEGTAPEHARPIRSENRATLVASIARGRRWLQELISDPTASPHSIAKRESCSVRTVNKTISLAFLAPDLVKAAIDGQLPSRHGRCPPRRLAA